MEDYSKFGGILHARSLHIKLLLTYSILYIDEILKALKPDLISIGQKTLYKISIIGSRHVNKSYDKHLL